MPIFLKKLNEATAQRLANLALACIHREYPNKLGHHVLNSDRDVRPPRELTPVFYGCYDWHSAVHAHWTLARLARLFPGEPWAERIRFFFGKFLNAQDLQKEQQYMKGKGRASFERPYGLAWLLQLAAELRKWDGRDAPMTPLVRYVEHHLTDWLRKLPYPVRSGEHSQSAFSLALMLDYARACHRTGFQELIESKIRQFYLKDCDCPLAYEPSGEDFLSPCLAEADVVRRVMPRPRFAEWLKRFLPTIPGDGSLWMKPFRAPDRRDPKLAHLDGLNLSRAWMMNGIREALPAGDKRAASLERTANTLARAGLKAVTGEHYEGAHWLGTFAVYLLGRADDRLLSSADKPTRYENF